MAPARRPRPVKVGRNAPIRGQRSRPKPQPKSTSAQIRGKVGDALHAIYSRW